MIFRSRFVARIKKEGDTLIVSPIGKVALEGEEPWATYIVMLEKNSDKRSLSQNALMWWTYQKEAELINGEYEGPDAVKAEDLYTNDIETYTDGTVVLVKPEAIPVLKASFRSVREVKRIYRRGEEYVVCQCWVGTSKWTKKRLAKFIEWRFQRLAEYGYDAETEYMAKLYNTCTTPVGGGNKTNKIGERK